MYRPWCAFTRAWSRADFASCSVAKPPTHRGLLTPVSGSLTRITYDQVRPRFMTPSRSVGAFLGGFRRAGWSAGPVLMVSGICGCPFGKELGDVLLQGGEWN